MSFEEIIEEDLADFNRLTALLIVGVSRDKLSEEFRGPSPVAGRSLWTYIHDLITEGSLVQTRDGKLKYRYDPLQPPLLR